MRKNHLRILALVLTVCLTLTGCRTLDSIRNLAVSSGLTTTSFRHMKYSRPDAAQMETALEACAQLAQNAQNVDELVDGINNFYDAYDLYYTNYVLADIHYSSNITDEYWKAEYAFCSEVEPTAEAMLEQLYCYLADSPLREELESDELFGSGFFDDYEEDPVLDETLVNLLEQEAALENRYYDIADRYDRDTLTRVESVYRQAAELYVELIRVRQEMADYLGYPNYPELAYQMHYSRDYYPAEAERYMERIAQALYDPYVNLENATIWDGVYDYCSEKDTYRYVQQAAQAMGGTIAEAFSQLNRKDLYDISYSENKMDVSFETYIWNYYAPFVFVNPYLDYTDNLTFAHEFGHFAADYASYGTYAGIDIAEVHSQTMEYLTLCYGRDTQMLTWYNLADSLRAYM